MVRQSASSKLFFLGMASVCVVAVFFMVSRHQNGVSDRFFYFYKSRCFVCRQWRFPCKRRGGVNTTLNPTHKSHARTRDFFTRGSRLESSSQDSQCVSQNSHSHIQHSMSHVPSLLYPSHLSTPSLSTCTPIRPSTRPSTRPLLMSSSHGFSLRRSIESVFRSEAETTSPTGYEPKDPTEESNSILVKPMFFHRPSMTST